MGGGTAASVVMELEKLIDTKDRKVNFTIFPNEIPSSAQETYNSII